MRYGAGLIPQQRRYMNRQEPVEAVAADSRDSNAPTGDLVKAVFGIIAGALTRGDSVLRVGFGSFPVGERAARTGRNPADRRRDPDPGGGDGEVHRGARRSGIR